MCTYNSLFTVNAIKIKLKQIVYNAVVDYTYDIQ